MPQERPGAVTLRGNPVTLIGPEVQVGQRAPDFTAIAPGMKPISLKDFAGQVKVISSVLSLDTGVCSAETKHFSDMARRLPESVKVITLSMDLPFAQQRWCGAQGVDNVVVASDFKDRQFGEAYGVRIKENGLNARAVFVVDQNDVVRHVEYVREATTEPDYEAVKRTVQQAVGA